MEQCLTVSQVNNVVKTLLETNAILKNVTVSGEICDLRFQSSGHVYFSLKDESGRIRCVLFKSNAAALAFAPDNGQDVIIKGSISVYGPMGQYQLIIRKMEQAGIGLLYQRFEALKQELALKGWFDEAVKKPLPTEIRRVGIVTSPSGAAIRDMISVISRRDSGVLIVLCPAQVQGSGSAESIAAGIERFNRLNNVDVIIIGRGGGSMEDLWCFNEAVVAEAIHFSKLPVISAVGHETDFTISDFVADLRAPTPSVAGELVSCGYSERLRLLSNQMQRMVRAIFSRLEKVQIQLDHAAEQLTACHPGRIVEIARMDVDRMEMKLCYEIQKVIDQQSGQLSVLMQKLLQHDLYQNLSRGFAVIKDQQGHWLTSSTQALAEKQLTIVFGDGELSVRVNEVQ